MISIARLLDRAKENAGIESDYRLAKVIGITHAAVSSYRMKKSMPDERVLEQLCALTGDDLAVVAAQIQSERARTQEGKNVWLMIAKRLSNGAGTAILSVLFTIVMIASTTGSARASGLNHAKNQCVNCLYIVSSTILTVGTFVQVRLRQCIALFRFCLWCCCR